MKLEEKVGELLKAKKNVIRHVTGEFQRVYKAKDENLNYEKELNAQLHKLKKMRQKYMDMYTDDLITREELNEKIGGTKQEIERLENELKMVAYHLTKGEQLETILNRTFKEIEDISDVHQMTNAQLKRIIQKIEVDKDGKWYWTYGGDYGPKDVPSFGNFCCNGLVNAVREPHPHLLEVKKIYQNIKSTLIDKKNLTVRVKNWFDFSDLNEYILHWKVTGDDGTVLAEGNKEVACEPHATVELTLGAVQLPKTIREAYLDLGWTRKKSTPLVDTAWEIAYDQFVLPASGKVWNGKPSEAGKTTFEVDENTGALKSLCPVTISLFRPATDNDNRDRMGAKLWRKAGLHTLTQKVVSLKESKTSATAQVNILNVTGKKVGDATLEYTLNHNGSLKVQTTFQPDTTWVKSIARLGLTFEMNDTYGNVTYLGRGEHETYIDRNQSGKIGIYTTTPEKMFHYYVIPQSTGNRTDVRWVKLADDSGKGCWIESDSPFQFSALPFSDLLLEKALHINDLERNGRITVHLDAKQAGVGTATCGPGVLPPYLVPLGKQTFTFTIYPVK